MDAHHNVFAQRLQLLRELDETIDFAKSVIQLGIVLTLFEAKDGLTIDELSEKLSERRKALIDAIRKLELKGIVTRVENNNFTKFILTDKGSSYVQKLVSLLSPQATTNLPSSIDSRMKRALILNNLIEAHYIYTAITTLAKTSNKTLSIDKLAKEMGLSVDRARSYLDLFCLPPYRVFRKIQRPGKTTYYRLEETGLKIYYKSPDFRKKTNLGERVESSTLLLSSTIVFFLLLHLVGDLVACLLCFVPPLLFFLSRFLSTKIK